MLNSRRGVDEQDEQLTVLDNVVKLRGGYLCILGLWFLVPQDVAAFTRAQLLLVAAIKCHCDDVAASLWPAKKCGQLDEPDGIGLKPRLARLMSAFCRRRP